MLVMDYRADRPGSLLADPGRSCPPGGTPDGYLANQPIVKVLIAVAACRRQPAPDPSLSGGPHALAASPKMSVLGDIMCGHAHVAHQSGRCNRALE